MNDTTPICDLERFKKTALSRRELAWLLLKQTRNPEYVAMRYDYPVETMRAALETIPHEDTIYNRLQRDSRVTARNANTDDGADAITGAETLSRARLDRLERNRTPGEDDDLADDSEA